jgi:hypothetical protein
MPEELKGVRMPDVLQVLVTFVSEKRQPSLCSIDTAEFAWYLGNAYGVQHACELGVVLHRAGLQQELLMAKLVCQKQEESMVNSKRKFLEQWQAENSNQANSDRVNPRECVNCGGGTPKKPAARSSETPRLAAPREELLAEFVNKCRKRVDSPHSPSLSKLRAVIDGMFSQCFGGSVNKRSKEAVLQVLTEYGMLHLGRTKYRAKRWQFGDTEVLESHKDSKSKSKSGKKKKESTEDIEDESSEEENSEEESSEEEESSGESGGQESGEEESSAVAETTVSEAQQPTGGTAKASKAEGVSKCTVEQKAKLQDHAAASDPEVTLVTPSSGDGPPPTGDQDAESDAGAATRAEVSSDLMCTHTAVSDADELQTGDSGQQRKRQRLPADSLPVGESQAVSSSHAGECEAPADQRCSNVPPFETHLPHLQSKASVGVPPLPPALPSQSESSPLTALSTVVSKPSLVAVPHPTVWHVGPEELFPCLPHTPLEHMQPLAGARGGNASTSGSGTKGSGTKVRGGDDTIRNVGRWGEALVFQYLSMQQRFNGWEVEWLNQSGAVSLVSSHPCSAQPATGVLQFMFSHQSDQP